MNVKFYPYFLIVFFCLSALAAVKPAEAAFANQSLLVSWADGRTTEEKIPAGQSLAKTLTSYQARADVRFAEANALYQSAVLPTDGFFDNQWYLKRIKAPRAWEVWRESPDVVIAVIDSGVDVKHPDLQDNIWRNIKEIPDNGVDDDHNGYVDDYWGYDFVNRSNNPGPKWQSGWTEDGVVHGTVVAGVLAASGNNTLGISGVTWHAQIMSLKALDDSGQANAAKVVEAIDYAVKNGAHIINLSFIGSSYSRAMEEAITRAYNAGVIVVAAGGNEISTGHGQDLTKKPMYPVCHDGAKGENMVIGVAATGPMDEKLSFSGYGRCIDIAAPGQSIFSTSVYKAGQGNSFSKYYDGYWSGTSLAVPQISGALALIIQANPNLSPREVAKVMLETADNIHVSNIDYINQLGYGRLNLDSAVRSALDKRNKQRSRIVAANYNILGRVKVITSANGDGQEFNAFPDGVATNITVGDVDGDSEFEIIASPAGAYAPEVRIFNRSGQLLKKLLVYDKNYRGGVSVASADIDGNGTYELAVAPSSSGIKQEIKVYSWQGKKLAYWQPYGANFKNGIVLAAGDLNGDGKAEVVSVPAKNSNVHVRIFSGSGKLVNQFFASETQIKGAWTLNISHDYDALARSGTLIVGSGRGSSPYVRVYDRQGRLLGRFNAFALNFLGGVNVAAADVDGDGKTEVVAGPGSGGSPNIAIYRRSGLLIKSFFADSKDRHNGVAVTILPIK